MWLQNLQLRHTVRRSNHGHTTRRPRFEALEDRCLLAITVNTLTDELDGNIVDGDISLRDAIAAAPVGETINFSVSGAINLTLGQLTIGRNLTVTGPGANQLKIDAGGASRVLELTAGTVDISGLSLTSGNDDYGGGVSNYANTTFTGVVIQGNGGALLGGGIRNVGTLTIADSTISGNSAGYGGGVYNANSLTIKNSTISGNSAIEGGGVYIYGAISTTISHSTISGNSASTGGGIHSHYANPSWLSHTLITGNSATTGSEISASASGAVNLNAFNLIGDSSHTTAQALDGVTAGATDILATSNGTNPTALAAILGPLANNGGPTKTQALVIGSPAINAGDPGAMAGDVPMYDQRGGPFARVYSGRIDIGAFELQPVGPALAGDYNQNGTVDAADYVVWRKTLGSNVANLSGADGSGNGVVDQADHAIWRAHFGQTAVSGAHVASVITAASTPASSVLDEAGHEDASQRLRPSSPLGAVEVRGASENQRKKMTGKEFAFVELAAPPVTSFAESGPNIRLSLGRTPAHDASRRDDALLKLLSQLDSKPKIKDVQEPDKSEGEERSTATGLHFNSIDWAFALLASS